MFSGVYSSLRGIDRTGCVHRSLFTSFYITAMLASFLSVNLPREKEKYFSLLLVKSIRDQVSKSPTEMIMPCYEAADGKTETTGD